MELNHILECIRKEYVFKYTLSNKLNKLINIMEL